MYEILEHTADVGLRVRAPDLPLLFAEAARALFSVIVANPEAVRPLRKIDLHVEAAARDDLLRDWLAELLYAFETRRLLLCEFDVRLDESGLSATARGEPLDHDRHELSTEVKAVTYHHLKVEPEGDGWVAEVILDI